MDLPGDGRECELPDGALHGDGDNTLDSLSLFQLLEQRLAPDRRNPAGTVAFRAKPLASWKPARHSAAALANRAHAIDALRCS